MASSYGECSEIGMVRDLVGAVHGRKNRIDTNAILLKSRPKPLDLTGGCG